MGLVYGIISIVILLLLLLLLASFARRSFGFGGGGGGGGSNGGQSSRRKVLGIFSNQGGIDLGTGPASILWDASTNTVHPQLSLDPVTGFITLPKGRFLVQYTVRLAQSPFNGTSTAIAQLQQTVNGTMLNITQPAIVQNSRVDGITDAVPQASPMIIASAIIHVTSSKNNQISVFFTPDTDNVMAATSGIDANAQIVISQQ